MPGLHKKLSPSGAPRWTVCPGSLTLNSNTNESSNYAREGTAAHALVHRCFLLDVAATDFPGQEVEGFEINQEMAEGVQLYLDVIKSEALKAGEGAEVEIEKFLTSAVNEDFGGTIDCLIVSPECLTIVDFKYGAGVGVEVHGNLQLLSYATIALSLIDQPRKVRLVVVQPRFGHDDGPVRSWEPTTKDLDTFFKLVADIWNMPDEEKHFKAGDHCRWCPHKVNCPELHKLTMEAARAEFAGVEITNGTAVTSMTPETAVEFREKRKAIELYFKAIEQWIQLQLESGVEVPGLKLVHKRSNRSWAVEEDTILRKCRSRKLGKKDIYETKLLSPARLEKLTDKKFVSQFCETRITGTTVVPVSDRREAIVHKTAAEEFSGVEG